MMMHAKHAKMNISNTKTNVQNVSASSNKATGGQHLFE